MEAMGHDVLGAAGPLDDKGNVGGDVVGLAVFAIAAHLAQILAVVRADNDGHIVINSLLAQLVKQQAQLLVRVPDAGIVFIDHMAEIIGVLDLHRLARGSGVGLVVISGHFAGRMSARLGGAVLIQNLLGHPGVRQRGILERLAILGRGTVRDVRVPHMHMQEPVFGIALAVQPVQRYRDHLVGRFQAALADVVGFVKAAVEPPRCVAVREAADAGGFHARAAQYGGQVVAAIEIGHAAVAALPTHFSVHSAVAYAAGVDTKPAGHQSGAARQAGSIGTIYIGKAHRIFGHFINIGAGGTRITIAAQVVWAQGVDIYIQNPHGNIPFYSYYLL